MVTRQRIATTALIVLALTGACGDRTVTSSPVAPLSDDTTATTRAIASPDVAGSNPAAPTAVSEAQTSLDDVDRILDEVQQDLNTADREASITEGDPTS